MFYIRKSVGKGGANVESDVHRVQLALNASSLVTRKLKADYKFGPATFKAILQFQLSIFENPHSCDGRIDPGGKTFKYLSNPAATAGKRLVPQYEVETLARKLGGHIGTGPVSSSVNLSAEQLAGDPRIKAMMDVLAFTEGTGTDYGKIVKGLVIKADRFPALVGKRDVSITDFSRHPEILVKLNAQISSTAAGRYQFLKKTWEGLGMSDFSARSQDIAAVKLMQGRGMIPFLLAGNLEEAVFKGALEWASFPKDRSGASAYPPQPALPLAKIREVYESALKKHQASS